VRGCRVKQLDDVYEPFEVPPAKVSSDRLAEDLEAAKEVVARGEGTVVIQPRPARFRDRWMWMCLMGLVIGVAIPAVLLLIGSKQWPAAVAVGGACFVFQSFVGWIIYIRQQLHEQNGPYAVFNVSTKQVDLLRVRGKPRVNYVFVRGFSVRRERERVGPLSNVPPLGSWELPLYQVCVVDGAGESHLIFVTEWAREFEKMMDALEGHGVAMAEPRVITLPRPARRHEWALN
jgi:hypothetical protein